MTDELKKEATTISKKTTSADKQKEKQRLALEKEREKQKDKQRLALEKEREKQKEKEKAAVDKALEKEREKQKASKKAAVDKAIEKEQQRIYEAIRNGENPFGDKPLDLSKKDSKEELSKRLGVEPKEVENDDLIDEDKTMEREKKSLEDILKEKEEQQKDKDVVSLDEHYDHVEVLRKKREAQKKLNEEMMAKQKEEDIRAKLLEQAMNNNSDEQEETNVDDGKINQLEDDKNQLLETIKQLSDELKNKDDLINKQDEEIKDKSAQIIILTNSVVNEEAPKIDDSEPISENEEFKEINEQGDILLRIKVLNEQIDKKDSQIKVVEDELSKLTEKDLIDSEFTQKISKVRNKGKDVVDSFNYELTNLAELIKNCEEKLDNKTKMYDEKNGALIAFDKGTSEKSLNYTEKEEAIKKRLPLSAEVDALKVELENLKGDYSKLMDRYKGILSRAETYVDSLNKVEAEMIELYLTKLREKKSLENAEYLSQKAERDNLVSELTKLNQKYEDLKNKQVEEENIEEVKVVDEELDSLKQKIASTQGKLVLLISRRTERENVEEVLRNTDPEIKTYLHAFSQKEIVSLELKDNENKLVSTQEELKTIDKDNTDELKKLSSYVARLEIIVSDGKDKLDYLEKVVANYANNEKVLFYKKLISSIDELNNREVELEKNIQELKENINKHEQGADAA